jgi:hypothetical protein
MAQLYFLTRFHRRRKKTATPESDCVADTLLSTQCPRIFLYCWITTSFATRVKTV